MGYLKNSVELAQFLSHHFFVREAIIKAAVEVSSCQQTRLGVVDANANANANASDVVDMDGYVCIREA